MNILITIKYFYELYKKHITYWQNIYRHNIIKFLRK